jgi:hypothetical protein
MRWNWKRKTRSDPKTCSLGYGLASLAANARPVVTGGHQQLTDDRYAGGPADACQITAGDLAEGDRLPSQRSCTSDLQVTGR